jgi:hypothetical protein
MISIYFQYHSKIASFFFRSLKLPRISGKRELFLECSDKTNNVIGTWKGTLDDRTRRWGKGRHLVVEPKMIENRFARVAPQWFYLLMSRFVACKESTVLWGGEIGATLLSTLFVTLSRIVGCTGPFTPGVDILARDLWELVWPLRIADVSHVRVSVLYAVGTALFYLPEETIYTLLMDSTSDNLVTNVQFISENDSDGDCRELANQLRTYVATTLHSMNHSHLLK